MKTTNNKILKKIFAVFSIFSVLAIISCTGTKNKEAAWDSEITIAYKWENDDSWDKNKFLELLAKNFNELKNSDNELKSKPDVKFNFKIISDDNQMLQNLKSDNINVDVGILPYYSFVNENIKDNFPLYIGQTGTLKFKWTLGDNEYYKDGLADDPLIKGAQLENQIQFSQPYGEFRNWKDTKETYGWDGSKYQAFYLKDKYTYTYRGSILVAGTPEEIQKIRTEWNNKDWNAFVKNGIIFKNFTSGGGFKYQASLIAEHFNNVFKSVDDVNKYFTNQSNQNNFLIGKDPNSIGQVQGNGRSYNIAFDDEGAFNWTPKKWGTDLYNPTNQKAVVRVLSLTNPAPYDAILGRVGLNKKEAKLIGEALEKIKGADNTLGIFTGYNYFKSAEDLINFSDFVALQKKAMDYTVDKGNIKIPSIN